MHTKWLPFNNQYRVLYWNSLFEFSIFMLFTLNHDPENFRSKSWAGYSLPFPDSLLPFSTVPYALAGCPPLISSTGSQSPWLPVGFSQWEAHIGGQRAGAERSWGSYSPACALCRLWVDYGCVLCCVLTEGRHLCCVTLSYSYSHSHNFRDSVSSIPGISLSCPFWLMGGKGSTLFLVLWSYTIPCWFPLALHKGLTT